LNNINKIEDDSFNNLTVESNFDNLVNLKKKEQVLSDVDKNNIIAVEDSIYNMAFRPSERYEQVLFSPIEESQLDTDRKNIDFAYRIVMHCQKIEIYFFIL
jgi:hypothetical protein